MKKANLFAIASLAALGAALAGAAVAQQAPAALADGPAPVAAAGKPTYGDFGVDEAGMDRSIQPGDDFYDYVNGAWSKNTPIPADKANYGSFDLLQDLSRERTHGILEAAKADPGSKIGAAYAAFLDQDTIEAKGLAPIKPWLDKVKALKSKAGYAALLAEADRNGVGVPFGAGVGQDAKDPEHYALQMRQAGLGLPDRDYYLSADVEACGGEGRLSGPYREDVRPCRRGGRRGARQGDRRFRDRDRQGELDADREPRRQQDL